MRRASELNTVSIGQLSDAFQPGNQRLYLDGGNADPQPTTTTSANSVSHTHSISSQSHTHDVDAQGAHTHTFTIASEGSDEAHENRPPFIALHYIIRVL